MYGNKPDVADPPGASDVGSVFAEHRLGLLRLAVLLVGDRATAEDVVQDAFTGLHRHWSDLQDSARALAYARTSVVNGCRMVLRRRSLMRRVGISHEPPIWSAESAVMLREDRREVIEALQRLPARRREVLILRYYLDLSDAEIAQIMGISQTTVRSTAARALSALGTLLEEGE
jgi:RNA polymerase sigma-70 factor (sigma-E family)